MEKKYYRPILKEGDHLVHSSQNPARVRGQSRDANNKNPDIVEWEEIDVDIEKLQEMAFHEKQTGQDRDLSRLDTLNSCFELLVNLSNILLVVLDRHPEYVVAIVERVRHIIQNVSEGKIVKVIKSAINGKQKINAERFLKEQTICKKQTDVAVKKMTSPVVEPIVPSEDEQKEDMSIEEARILILNILRNYISMKKNLDRLSKANISESELLQIDVNQVLAYMDSEIDKFPAVMDEKTSLSVNDILNENSDIAENIKIRKVLKIEER